MQTLRKLFFKKFLKEWALISVSSYLVISFMLMFHGHIPALFIFIGVMYALFAPIAHAAVTNNDFQENLDWLINFQYNRKQLIKFYFSTQSIKLFLVTCTYSVYFLIFALGQMLADTVKVSAKDKGIITDFIEFAGSWSGISIIYFIFLAAIYAVYFASLFKANAEYVRRLNITKVTKKSDINLIDSIKNMKEWDTWQYIAALWICALIIILFGIEIDSLHAIIFLSTFIGYASVQIFNRKFKVLSLNRAKTLSIALSVMLVAPHFLFYLGSITDITNNRKNLNARINSLEYISSHYTTDYKVLSGMFRKAKTCEQFEKLSAYAGKKNLEPKYFVRLDVNFCKFSKTVHNYDHESDSNKYISQLIVITEKYIQDNSLEEHKQIILAGALAHHKIPRHQLNPMMEENSVFKKYLALRLAKKSLSHRKYKTFVKVHYEDLPESIKKLGSVKRAIASISRDSKSKENKNDKNHFDYSRY